MVGIEYCAQFDNFYLEARELEMLALFITTFAPHLTSRLGSSRMAPVSVVTAVRVCWKLVVG